MKHDEQLERYAGFINKTIESFVSNAPDALMEAMRYSLRGGKRLRGALLMEFYRINGGSVAAALPYACAIEMIHAYSLIHDDLPCMDDDDMRRGQPTNHKVYGEAMALLAGDGLLNLAFEVMLDPENTEKVGSLQATRAAYAIARASGARGMAGGQAVDLASAGRCGKLVDLRRMHALKTGAMIRAACTAGAILGGADETKLNAADGYAAALGLAFQIRDDMLDIEGDAAVLGKTVGNDSKRGLSTYPSFLGMDGCRAEINRLTEKAKSELGVYTDRNFLCALADEMAMRIM